MNQMKDLIYLHTKVDKFTYIILVENFQERGGEENLTCRLATHKEGHNCNLYCFCVQTSKRPVKRILKYIIVKQ